MSKEKLNSVESSINYGLRLNRPMFIILEEYFQKIYSDTKLNKKDNITPLLYINERGGVITTNLFLDNIGTNDIGFIYTNVKEKLKFNMRFDAYRESDGTAVFYCNLSSEVTTFLNGSWVFNTVINNAIKTSNLKGKMLSMKDNDLDWDVVEPPKRDFNDIFLPNRLSNDLHLFRQIYKNQGKLLRYLLVGAAGSGKTESTIVLSNEMLSNGVTIIKTKIDDYFSDKIELAETLAPSIVVLDDVDLSLGNRNNGGVSPYLQSFLDVLDGTQKINAEVGILATTNSVELLDVAARRAGRFDKIIIFDEITKDNIKGIIKKTLFLNHDIKDVDPVFLADNVSNLFFDNKLTGSHVYNMIDLMYRKMLIEDVKPDTEWIINSLNDEIEMLEKVSNFESQVTDRMSNNTGSNSIGFGKVGDHPQPTKERYRDVVASPTILDDGNRRRRR